MISLKFESAAPKTLGLKPGPRKMRIEAVIPCLNYSDFLAETLPRNLAHFDNVVVVTSFADKATQELCRRLSVECRPTDEWFTDGDKQNLGRGVNYGLGFCRQNAWLCRLDADIYLPPNARNWIEWSRPDPGCIYGIDRVNCIGYESWKAYIGQQKPDTQHLHHYLVCPPHQHGKPWPLGARLAIKDHGGFIPIGFFQLWHSKHGRRYPVNYGSAEHTDVQHSLQWPEPQRRLMPEVIAVHLESEAGKFGCNWEGRTTKPFCPPPPYGVR